MAALSPEDVAALAEARYRMSKGFSGNLVVAELAAAAGMSKYRFIRSFADVYGETPGSYLTRRKMEQAQRLLVATRLPIGEVARSVGYRSHGTFSERFRKFAGMPPSAYRECHRPRPTESR